MVIAKLSLRVSLNPSNFLEIQNQDCHFCQASCFLASVIVSLLPSLPPFLFPCFHHCFLASFLAFFVVSLLPSLPSFLFPCFLHCFLTSFHASLLLCFLASLLVSLHPFLLACFLLCFLPCFPPCFLESFLASSFFSLFPSWLPCVLNLLPSFLPERFNNIVADSSPFHSSVDWIDANTVGKTNQKGSKRKEKGKCDEATLYMSWNRYRFWEGPIAFSGFNQIFISHVHSWLNLSSSVLTVAHVMSGLQKNLTRSVLESLVYAPLMSTTVCAHSMCKWTNNRTFKISLSHVCHATDYFPDHTHAPLPYHALALFINEKIWSTGLKHALSILTSDCTKRCVYNHILACAYMFWRQSPIQNPHSLIPDISCKETHHCNLKGK